MQELNVTDNTYLQVQGRGGILLGVVQVDGTVKVLATFERLTPEEILEVVNLLQLGLETSLHPGPGNPPGRP